MDIYEFKDDGVFKFSISFHLMKESVEAFDLFIKKIEEIKKSDKFDSFLSPPICDPFPSKLSEYDGCVYVNTFSEKLFSPGNFLFSLTVWWKEKEGER
jgi:hypothetical protein